jgi:hypothetical protein
VRRPSAGLGELSGRHRTGKAFEFATAPDATLDSLAIGAVIMEDGTIIGHPKSATGVDMINQILQVRKGTAEVLNRWRSIVKSLPDDPHLAIQSFLQQVQAIPARPASTQQKSDLEFGRLPRKRIYRIWR